ncbi:MAG: DUF4330 family protein [Candidatus Omnitrophica bacterium]|nr:DUF4330 family protein [Candidatus Omnitrophota bacterium]
MKLIDANGKLFGKVNLFDAIVVGLLLVGIPAGLVSHKLMAKRRAESIASKHYTEMVLDVAIFDLQEDDVHWLRPGLKGYDSVGRKTSEILELGKAQLSRYPLSLGKLVEIEHLDQGRYEVPARIRIAGRVTWGEFAYDQQPLKMLYPFNLVIEGRNLKARILGWDVVAPLQENERWITAVVQWKGATPEIVPMIKVGDVSRDIQGRRTGEIVSILQREYLMRSPNVFVNTEGQVVANRDPATWSAVVAINLLCSRTANGWTYQDEDVRAGENMEFITSDYIYRGTILHSFPSDDTSLSELEKLDYASLSEWMVVLVQWDDLVPDILSLVKEGDRTFDMEGNNVGELVSLVQRRMQLKDPNVIVDEEGQMAVSPASVVWRTVAVLRLFCRRNNQGWVFQGKDVRAGSPLEFFTKEYVYRGVVLRAVPEDQLGKDELLMLRAQAENPRFMKARLRCFQVLPEIAGAIRSGDVEKTTAGVFRGAKLLELSSNIPQPQDSAYIGPGMQQFNGRMREIEVWVEMPFPQESDLLFFQSDRLRIGTVLSLCFEDYELTGTVVEIVRPSGESS